MALEQCKGTTKGPRVIKSIVPHVLSIKFVDYRHVLTPFAAAETNLLYLTPTGSQPYWLIMLKTKYLQRIEPLLLANHVSVFYLSIV